MILGSLLFLGKNYYFYANYVLQLLSVTIVFVTLIMILFRKDGRGLHDYLVKTKVVPLNDDVMDGVVLETKEINNSQEKDIDGVGNKDDDSIEKENNDNKD